MKFSFGIPAYKLTFIEECIQSILNQSYQNFELIIVNDASPEDLDSCVNLFDDQRIRYYKNDKNFGAINVVDNWNKCLSYSSGDFFILMGDDDTIHSDFLLEFTRLINKYPDLDVYHCRSFIINDRGEKTGLTPSWPEFESVYDNIFHRMQHGRMQYISDFVYRTAALKSYDGFFKLPLAWGSDDITAYRAASYKGIAHCNKPLFNYRVSELTISKSGNSELKMLAYLGYEKWLKEFISKEPTTDIDIVILKNIIFYLPGFIKRKKGITIRHSFKLKGYKQFIFWFKLRKKYGLSSNQLIVEYLKFIFQGK